jgi:tetratricopeptide (TPR) repeat protein
LKFSVLLQNEVSKEFTSLDREVYIPEDREVLQMTSLITGYDMKAGGGRIRPFQNGDNQIFFRTNRVFTHKDDLWLSFQIHGVGQVLREHGELQYLILREQEEVLTFARNIRELQGLPNVTAKIDLDQLPPAHYEVHVSLILDGREVLREKEEFDISHVASIPRPWFHTRSLSDTDAPILDFTLGTQYHNNGQFGEARRLLDRAFQANPQSQDIAMQFSRTLLELKEYATVEFILKPFTDQPEPIEFQAYLIMGEAYRSMGKLNEAVGILSKSLRLSGLNPLTLNALGDCYIDLQNYPEALKALEKSLELDPLQDDIKAKAEKLRKKMPSPMVVSTI